MTIQRIYGTFRTGLPASIYVNAVDSAPIVAPGTGYSAGATLIDAVNFQPPVGQQWLIVGFSIVASLSFVNEPGAAGKLNKIRCGLIVDGDPTSGGVGTPWTSPMLPVPGDDSLMTDLWNPSVDQLPPDSSLTPLSVNANVILPLPLDLLFHNLAIGIWILPFLVRVPPTVVSSVFLYVKRAKYTVIYDDGR